MDNNVKKDDITMASVSNAPRKTSANSSYDSHDKIIKLLETNLEISQELLGIAKKMKRFIAFQRAWVIVKVLVIAVPLVLGAIYLPPLLSGVIGQYQSLLNLGSGAPTQNIDPSAIQGLID